jgi:hypothetical protein
MTSTPPALRIDVAAILFCAWQGCSAEAVQSIRSGA